MYDIHIVFDNDREPVTRFGINRREYNEEMRKWQIEYDLEIDRVEELKNGDRLIFAKAYERTTRRLLKNIERGKSRARYYSRTADRAGKGDRTGIGAQG